MAGSLRSKPGGRCFTPRFLATTFLRLSCEIIRTATCNRSRPPLGEGVVDFSGRWHERRRRRRSHEIATRAARPVRGVFAMSFGSPALPCGAFRFSPRSPGKCNSYGDLSPPRNLPALPGRGTARSGEGLFGAKALPPFGWSPPTEIRGRIEGPSVRRARLGGGFSIARTRIQAEVRQE